MWMRLLSILGQRNVAPGGQACRTRSLLITGAMTEGAKSIVGYVIGLIFIGLWFAGWISDIAARDFGWAVAGFVVPPLGMARGLSFLRRLLKSCRRGNDGALGGGPQG